MNIIPFVLALGLSGSHPDRISPEDAMASAVNDLVATEHGFELQHPQHRADFTAHGVSLRPARGGPLWQWRWCAATAGTVPLDTVNQLVVAPRADVSGRSIVYDRGAIEEQYVLKSDCIEQRFIIECPLSLHGADLTIDGSLECAGTFERTPRGWQWRTPEGLVSLGRVTVFDAAGHTLPATMTVTAAATSIVVDGPALDAAVYPVTIDPEIGSNDLRISDMGPDGDWTYDALRPAVAYNPVDQEYLVVWEGDDDGPGLAEGEFEIFGQFVDALSGLPVGPDDFRISDIGPDGDSAFDAERPSVVYNATDHRFLVVWAADDLVSGDFEVHGQLIDAATRLPLGADDFRISDVGPEGDPLFSAQGPEVAWNSIDNEYLVVWEANDTGIAGEFEIYGQRLNSLGEEIGVNDFRISDAGVDGDTLIDADQPAVAYNFLANEYLVVWEADDDAAGLAEGEMEIYGQRLAADGTEIGANDFRISDMGPDGDALFDAERAAVAYNGLDNEYLVVWEGDDDSGGLVNGESEIFGQRLDAATGLETGDNDFRISEMGPPADPSYDADRPAVIWNAAAGEYLVVWRSDDSSGSLANNEMEIFGQRLDATGLLVGVTGFRLSDMGDLDGDPSFDAGSPTVAAGGAGFFVVWEGDDGGLLADDEQEIYGQLIDGAGLELGINDMRLSEMGPDGDTLLDARKPAVAWSAADNRYLVVWEGDDNTLPLVDGEFEIFGQFVDGTTGEAIGENDFRISSMGPDGDPLYDAEHPAVVWNATSHEYLVVWEGDDDVLSGDGELEIFGQRLDAAGLLLGAAFRISDMGPDGVSSFDAGSPALAWNSIDNEYLVVWEGDDDPNTIDGEFEIFGQRLGADGLPLGVNDFRISDMGPDGVSAFDANRPDVAHSATTNGYLVVWEGDDDANGIAEGELEIYGQRLDADGVAQGVNDFRISDMGPDGVSAFDAAWPAIAWNSQADEYLVVWEGDDDSGDLVNGESEIFGQRLDAATGEPVGDNDFRISDMGPASDPAYDAERAAVDYDADRNEYFIVWVSDHNAGTLADNEIEVFGQRLDAATGAPVGELGVRLSDMGPDGDASFDADNPAVAWNSLNGEHLVIWQGDNTSGPLVDEELEIYVQRFDAASPCPPDTNGDGTVDVADLVVVVLAWGTASPAADVNGDGIVDVLDMVQVILNWGPCAG